MPKTHYLIFNKKNVCTFHPFQIESTLFLLLLIASTERINIPFLIITVFNLFLFCLFFSVAFFCCLFGLVFCLVIFVYCRSKQIKLSNKGPGNIKHGKENRLQRTGKLLSVALSLMQCLWGLQTPVFWSRSRKAKAELGYIPLKVLGQPKLVYYYAMYIHKHTLLKSHSQSQLCRKFL